MKRNSRTKDGSKTKGGCGKGTTDGIGDGFDWLITGTGNAITDPTSVKFPGLIDKDSI